MIENENIDETESHTQCRQQRKFEEEKKNSSTSGFGKTEFCG